MSRCSTFRLGFKLGFCFHFRSQINTNLRLVKSDAFLCHKIIKDNNPILTVMHTKNSFCRPLFSMWLWTYVPCLHSSFESWLHLQKGCKLHMRLILNSSSVRKQTNTVLPRSSYDDRLRRERYTIVAVAVVVIFVAVVAGKTWKQSRWICNFRLRADSWKTRVFIPVLTSLCSDALIKTLWFTHFFC